MPRGSEVQISHKTSKKYLKNIQKSITELLHLAAATTRRIIVPHVTYKILDLFGLSKFKGGNAPLAPLIQISLLRVWSNWNCSLRGGHEIVYSGSFGPGRLRPRKCTMHYGHRRMRRGGAGGAAAPPPPQLLGNSVFWAAAVLLWGSSNGGRGVFFNFPEGGWRHADNVQGGGGACECPRVGVFLNFPEGEWRHADNVQGGGVLVKSPPLQEILLSV